MWTPRKFSYRVREAENAVGRTSLFFPDHQIVSIKGYFMLNFARVKISRHGESESTWSESHSVVSDSLPPYGLYSPWNSSGQNTGVDSLSPFQGIFPTQGSNPGLSHCRLILYQLSHKGSPRVLELVAYPFLSGSSQPRNRTGVSCTAGGFFTN